MTKQTFLGPICALAAAISVVAVMAASAQTQAPQPAPPAAQQQPTAPADGAGMPAQGMEHGRRMQNMGQTMMGKEMGKEGERTGMGAGPMGAPPAATEQQPAAPTTGASSMPAQGMEHGGQMQNNMGPRMMEKAKDKQ